RLTEERLMSNPTANPTRQQLDELDALLQRMLSLPLNQLDAEMAPAPPPAPPAAPPAAAPPAPAYVFSSPTVPASPRPAPAMRPAAPPPQARPPARPAPALPRRTEVAPGDHSWNV